MKKNYFSRMKGIGKTGLFMLALSASSLVYADTTTGLKLHYTFENVTGGLVTDATGNGLDGSLMGASVVVPGVSGNGVNFPTASNPAVDYILLPNGITGSLTDFTVATWVKMDRVDWWMRVFDLGSGTANYIMCTAMGGNFKVEFKYNDGGGQFVDTPSPLPTGKWVHVALTCSYVDGVGLAKLYLDGTVVGSNSNITITPAMLDALTGTPTNQNYIAKSQWGDNGLNGTVDDFRIYSRALTGDDVLELTGTPPELVTQWKALTIAGDLANITSNVVLPTTMGTGGVTVKWASTNNAVLDTLGTVVRPSKFDAVVILTATCSMTVDTKVYVLTKTFTVTVPALVVQSEEVAKWDFKSANITVANGVTTVKDDFENAYVATLMNEARIRTIGTTTKYNVLDLGNGKGYLDMGTDIGEAIYALNNYTMSAYFRIDADYANLNDNGNFIWNFSNSVDVANDKNGYIIGSLKNQSQNCTSGRYDLGDQYIGKGVNAPKAAPNASAKDGWHHMAYVQNGTAGTVYIDGVALVSGTMLNPPSIQLPKPGFTGTPFNWLGRPCYATDVYLRKTLVYDFRLYRFPLSDSDMNSLLEVPTVINNLNEAYAQDSDYKSPALALEVEHLTLGDLTAVTSDITLPLKGTLDNTIDISWKSSNTGLISDAGVLIARPDFYNLSAKLTAILSKDGQTFSKVFPLTVLVKPGTEFTGDLLVKFDFSTVANDTVVTDAAEKHFTGVARKGAMVRTIGTTAPMKVLALGDSIGYFDMGTEMGKVMYHLNDYTMGAFYRVDADYTKLKSNGNWLWNFSNSKNVATDANGYIFTGLRNQNVTISSAHWTAEQSVTLNDSIKKGEWHHIAYTQSDTIGTIYVDGWPVQFGTVKLFPSAALAKDGFMGSVYNWLGRSCYVGDVYLRKTLVSDFRLYNRALSVGEIENSLMQVTSTLTKLNTAYNEGFQGVKDLVVSPYKVISTVGKIRIIGLTGSEKVSLFDVTGRQMMFNTPAEITAKAGVYIVKINGYNTKVIVK